MAYHNVYGIDLGTSAVKIYSHKKKRTITEKNMIALKDGEITKVPLSEVAGKLKTVDPNAQIIKHAKLVGISFGD